MSGVPVQFARATRAAWLASSAVMLDGQMGVCHNSDGTDEYRVGDGINTFFNLPTTSVAALANAVQVNAQTFTSGQQLQARTNIGAVAKGSVSFNVRDYGAVGDWSTGTTGTADATAIRAALTAAAAAVAAGASAARVLVPWTTGNGYEIDDTIVTPAGVEWDMRAPMVYTGPTGRAALTIGSSTAERGRLHRIKLMRYALTDWTSEADAGLVIRNQYGSVFHIDQCDQFTVGVTCMGDTSQGFSYCKVYFDQLIDNKIALDLTNDTGGWCNQNDFFGGRYVVSSSTYTTTDRIGVRITSRATTKYYNNANTFYSPSFELKGSTHTTPGTGIGTCLEVDYGSQNAVIKGRHESNSAPVLRQLNNSTDNAIDFSYSDQGSNAPALSLEGASASGILTTSYTQMVDGSLRVVHKVNTLGACYYDGATSINIPGLTVGTSGTTNTDARAASSLVLGADYVEIPSSRYAGFYLSTKTLKRFAVLRDVEASFGGRILIRCYDSSNSILTDTTNSGADVVKTTNVANNPAYATSYGGGFRTGVDSTAAMFFAVSANTDHVFVAAIGGTAACRLRALSVAAVEPVNPAAWLAFPDGGENYGTTPPTSGTWAVGKRVINATPTTSGPVGWVCTTAGTPGTWRSYGDVTGGTQIDFYTANATWTKPTGAKTVRAYLIGGGSGGGSGRRGAAGTVRCGGGGAGGAGASEFVFDPADLTSTVSVIVGAGGAGGAAATTDDTNGNAGALGASTNFGGSSVSCYASTSIGTAGAGGTNALGSGGTAGPGTIAGGAGGAASTTGLVGSPGIGAGGAGGAGAGGGITSANVAAGGGNGAYSRTHYSGSTTGGVVDTTVPVVGTAPTPKGVPGPGGGGGAASITTAAQAGADATGYGGGGAGGGASLNGNNSGRGGNGAPGCALVITTF